MRHQSRPHHGIEAFADGRLGRHVDEDGAEQRERDADAAENEIFPRRLERLMRPVDADHHHRGERGKLDRHPHHADIVGHEREIEREHQHLIHGVIEAQEGGREPADLQLVLDIARAEHAGGEADERGEHDEDVVEVVDQDVGPRRRPREEEQRQRGEEGQERRNDVEIGRALVARQQRRAGAPPSREWPGWLSPHRSSFPFTAIEIEGRQRRRCRTARECGTGRCR